MKILVFSFIAFLLICSSICEKENKYFDTEEDVKLRNEFYRNYTYEISQGRISFEYSEQYGTYCKAEKDITAKEFTFTVPSDYLICSHNVFPFQYEIKDVLVPFLDTKFQNKNETRTKLGNSLFALKILFELHADKNEIYSFLEEIGKTNYISPLNEKQLNYLKTLPRTLYSNHFYDKEEIELIKLIGIRGADQMIDFEIWEHLVKFFQKHKLGKYIIPWIDNYHNFRRAVSLINTRAYRVTLAEYEKLIGQSILDVPNGSIIKQYISETTVDFAGSCLIPFADMCNHRQNYDPEGKDKVDFYLNFGKGRVSFSLSKHFKAGEEYNYQYIPYASNEKLLFSYGFYLHRNVYSAVAIQTSLTKQYLTKEKYEFLKKLNLIENIDQYMMSNQVQNIPYTIVLNQNKVNKGVINLFKVYIQPVDKFNPENTYNLLFNNHFFNYNIEITAQVLNLASLIGAGKNNVMGTTEMIHSYQITRDYYKKMKDMFLHDSLLRYKYRMRRKIMYLARELKYILNMNLNFAIDETAKLMRDNFGKIRNHWVGLFSNQQ